MRFENYYVTALVSNAIIVLLLYTYQWVLKTLSIEAMLV